MTVEPKRLDFACTADEFKIAVRGRGVKVEIDVDGNVTIYSNRAAKLLPPEAPTGASPDALKIGAKMADGSVYAGV